jgi:acyl carrier protein
MDLREKIIVTMQEIAHAAGANLVEELNDETVLLKSGLDSLGFAILVARLEEDLGFDPFTMTDEPIYPSTLGDFVNFYQVMSVKHNDLP